MPQLLSIFYTIVLMTPGFASELTPFPDSPLVAAEGRLNRFIDAERDDGNEGIALNLLEVKRLPALNLILKVSLERWNRGPLTSRERKRVDYLLEFGTHQIFSMDDSVPQFKERADALLTYYDIDSAGQKTMLRIFDRFQLWTETNFLFLERLSRTESQLRLNFERLNTVLPRMKPEQVAQIAENLRGVRPFSLIQLSLLMQIGPLRDSELITLFKLAADNFSLWQALGTDRLNLSREEHLFAPIFKRLILSLQSGDAATTTAANKALQYFALRPRRAGYALRFFALLKNPQMEWLHPETWVENAPPRTAIGRTTSDNIIRLQFRGLDNCEDDL